MVLQSQTDSGCWLCASGGYLTKLTNRRGASCMTCMLLFCHEVSMADRACKRLAPQPFYVSKSAAMPLCWYTRGWALKAPRCVYILESQVCQCSTGTLLAIIALQPPCYISSLSSICLYLDTVFSSASRLWKALLFLLQRGMH